MFRFVLIFILFNSLAFGQNAKGIFSIVVEGKRSDLAYIKKRSELAMARSTKYCRGSKMPKAKSSWSCKKSAPRVSSCVLEYKCQFVNKKFSRLSETRRIRAELKSIPKSKSKYKITLIHKDRKEVMKQLGGGKFVAQKPKSKTKSYGTQYLAAGAAASGKPKTITSGNPVAKTKKSKPKTKKSRAKSIEKEELDALSQVKEDDFLVDTETPKEEEWVFEKIEKTDGSKEFQVYKKEDKNKGKSSTPTGKRNQWASFALSYVSVSDSLENSLATFDAAWTPFMWFSNSLGLRGQLGVHQFKLGETATTEEETFLIYDIGAFGTYRLGNFFAELGLGMQIWNNSNGDSFNTFTLGGGYIFEYYKLKFIDRIQAGFSSVSNDISTKEFRVSVGISF
jgi:hypothetical protein